MFRRRCITLIELLLVCALIAMVGGIVAINVGGAVGQQRFRSDVEAATDTLRLAQQLMLVASADIELKFKGNTLQFSSSERLDPRLERMIGSVTNLLATEKVTLDGVADPTLAFMSQGAVMPKGALTFTGTNGETHSLVLTGAPTPLSRNQVRAPTLNMEDLIEATRQEIASQKAHTP